MDIKTMWYRLKLLLSDPSKNLWVHPTLGAIFAILFSLLASVGNYLLPEHYVPHISAETLSSLLDIIASSMLAVTTFSLSIMVSALASTSNTATPRARLLIIEDDYTRIAIASFISAFIYSVIAKIALGLKYYGTEGRFLLFLSTIIVLLYLIYTLIRWVQTISGLGSLNDALSKIENKSRTSLSIYRAQPDLGAKHSKPILDTRWHIYSQKTGYICNLNLEEIQKVATKYQCHIHICVRAGKFVEPRAKIFAVYPKESFSDHEFEKIESELDPCAVIGLNRTYEQDPRFGLLVMSEVAQRALSPAVNDPATAINVLNALTRLLVDTHAKDKQECPEYDLLSIEKLDMEDLIRPVFSPISRDSIANLEIGIRLIKTLAIISRHAPEIQIRQYASKEAANCYHRSKAGLSYAPDRDYLKHEFEQSFKN